MKVTVLHILTFFSSICLVFGVWQFLWIIIHKKGYEMEKQDDESFPDFLFRYYADELPWKLRKRFMPKWFYYSKIFLISVKIKGVVLIVCGVLIAIAIFWVSKSEYAPWLHIEF